jgi:hypothetical protein
MRLFSLLFLPLVLAAQEVEVAGFVGAAAGPGTHAVYGGSVGIATSEHLMPLLEFSYFGLGDRPFNVPGWYTPSFRIHDSSVWDVNAGMHVQFPTQTWKFVPYAAFGLGFNRSRFTSTHERFMLLYSEDYSDTSFAVNAGGGVRFPIRGGLGVRPELKIFTGGETYGRISIGVYYQFR